MSETSPGRRANGQFEKGYCPYRGGRGPSKAKRTQTIDFAALLNDPIAFQDRNGESREMSPLEISLRRHAAKASKGDVRSARYFLNLCLDHGVLAPQPGGGPVTYPADMPIALARRLVERHGRPPWSARQISAAAAWLRNNGGAS